MKTHLKFLAFISLLGTSPAFAFQPPSGCQGAVTVHYEDCMMSHTWSCSTDPEGIQWQALYLDEKVVQLRKIDADFQWLATSYFNPPVTEVLQQPAVDPASLTELLESGEDTYDFEVGAQGNARRYVGSDKLTGQTVVIDGKPLSRTAFEYEVFSNDEKIDAVSGRQYVLKDQRIFLFGSSWKTDAPGDVTEYTPRLIELPGEPGFMSDRPLFGCSLSLAHFESLEGAAQISEGGL